MTHHFKPGQHPQHDVALVCVWRMEAGVLGGVRHTSQMNTKTKKKVRPPPPSTSNELSDAELKGVVGGTPGEYAGSTPKKETVSPPPKKGRDIIVGSGAGATPWAVGALPAFGARMLHGLPPLAHPLLCPQSLVILPSN